MKELFNDFLYYVTIDCALSKNTRDAYENDLRNYFSYLTDKGITDLSNVKPDDIRNYLHFCLSEGLTNKTIERRASTIRVFHRYLYAEKKLGEDPASFLEAPKLGKYLPSVLSDEEMQSLIAAVETSGTSFPQRDRLIVELLYDCGLRVSELSNLKISQIKVTSKFLRITGKGNKERIIPLGDVACDVITTYLNSEYRDLTSEHSKDYVILSRSGRRLDRHNIFRVIQKLAALSGVKRAVSPHTLRHSFATELLKGGADIRGVQELLGHSSIVTTEIYTHVDKKRLKDSHSKFHPRG